jgi:hypothetical protein
MKGEGQGFLQDGEGGLYLPLRTKILNRGLL